MNEQNMGRLHTTGLSYRVGGVQSGLSFVEFVMFSLGFRHVGSVILSLRFRMRSLFEFVVS